MNDARPRRGESGLALLVTMLLMSLMGIIGLAALDTVTRDRQVAGYGSQAQNALYAADGGVADSLEVIRTEIVGAALTGGDCLTTPVPSNSLPNGTSYGPDVQATSPPICMIAISDPCAVLDSSIEMGQPIYLNTLWNVQTQGTAPGGATARLQATAERCHAFNN